MITIYKTITKPTQAEFKDKGSRFIAYAYPIRTLADVKKYLDPLKEEHHKARHWCYAYRLGVDGQMSSYPQLRLNPKLVVHPIGLLLGAD